MVGGDRLLARYGDRLGAQALLPGGGAREEVQRPGQQLGGRLVAGGEERDEIVDELLVGHGLARVGAARLEQAAKDIAALVGLAAPAPHEARDGGALVAGGPQHATLAGVPDPVRQIEHGVGDRPADGVERRLARAPDDFALVRIAAGEDGVGDDLEGRLGHRRVDGGRAPRRQRASGRAAPPPHRP